MKAMLQKYIHIPQIDLIIMFVCIGETEYGVRTKVGYARCYIWRAES